MKIVIILLAIEVIVSIILKIFVSNMGKKGTQQLAKYKDFVYTYSEWQPIPEIEEWITNADAIDKMRSNLNSPVRVLDESYYDGLMREIGRNRQDNLPENRIIKIISNRMENV